MHTKRIAITGLGPIGSPGIGKEAFWQGILGGKGVRLNRPRFDGHGKFYTFLY